MHGYKIESYFAFNTFLARSLIVDNSLETYVQLVDNPECTLICFLI